MCGLFVQIVLLVASSACFVAAFPFDDLMEEEKQRSSITTEDQREDVPSCENFSFAGPTISLVSDDDFRVPEAKDISSEDIVASSSVKSMIPSGFTRDLRTGDANRDKTNNKSSEDPADYDSTWDVDDMWYIEGENDEQPDSAPVTGQEDDQFNKHIPKMTNTKEVKPITPMEVVPSFGILPEHEVGAPYPRPPSPFDSGSDEISTDFDNNFDPRSSTISFPPKEPVTFLLPPLFDFIVKENLISLPEGSGLPSWKLADQEDENTQRNREIKEEIEENNEASTQTTGNVRFPNIQATFGELSEFNIDPR